MSTTLNQALSELTGNTTIGGNLIVDGIVKPNAAIHAFWWFGDETETFTYALADTWYFLTNATNDLFTVAETEYITSAGDKMTVEIAGDYTFIAKITGEGSNGVVYAIRLFNETTGLPLPTAGAITARGAGNKVTAITVGYGEDLSVGDVIRLETMSDSAGTGEINAGNFQATFVHNGAI